MLTKPSLTLKRRLKARRRKSSAPWTDPKKIVRWFGPEPRPIASSVRAEMDVRAGGRYRISFKTEDGEYHEVGGVYREVVPHQPPGVHLGLAFDARAQSRSSPSPWPRTATAPC